jgi:hypothetical protein
VAQQYYVQIRSAANNAMSGMKPASPKMINAMKAIALQYTELFDNKHSVHRFIRTPKEYKRV